MKNQVQLITYVDRLGGGGLRELQALLQGPLQGLFGGVHLLPFFTPIDGADAGFDPVDHGRVDPRLGDWGDLRALAAQIDVMADVIVNHVSADSPPFQDFLRHGEASRHAGLFLRFDSVFPRGARAADLLAIYRPRPGLPFTAVTLADGSRRLVWTTFTPQQIDIDVAHPQGRAYLDGIVQTLAASGVRMLRLDAAGYAVKQAGTSCFMTPATFDFIREFGARAKALGMEVLVEIHSHHRLQIEIASQVDWVYDFALPPLLLHALHFGRGDALKRWIALRPVNAITVLDTHDGIGVIDIGADPADREGRPGLVPPAEVDALVERVHDACRGESRSATGAAASNLDLYQVNCSFYDALGADPQAYLVARAVQFFVPGIPQVYYVGLLAGRNDMALLQATGVGRDINRRRYRPSDIDAALQQPVVQALLSLIRLRNRHPAFHGEFELLPSDDGTLAMRWTAGEHRLSLHVALAQRRMRIVEGDSRGEREWQP